MPFRRVFLRLRYLHLTQQKFSMQLKSIQHPIIFHVQLRHRHWNDKRVRPLILVRKRCKRGTLMPHVLSKIR